MNCEEVLLLISGHLDEMNTPEEEAALQAHLAVCGHCREVLSTFRENDKKLVAAKEPAQKDLCGNVMAQIKKEAKKKNAHRWSGLAVAAALVLVMGIAAVRPSAAEQGPRMVSEAQTYTMSRTLPVQDGSAVAQRIADERSGAVAVVHELYYEIESYPCETLEEGYLLYILPDHNAAVFLSETYGCVIYEPQSEIDQTVSYALLVP